MQEWIMVGVTLFLILVFMPLDYLFLCMAKNPEPEQTDLSNTEEQKHIKRRKIMFVRRKEFKELKEKVEELQGKVEIMEFLKENPNGFKIDYEFEKEYLLTSFICYYLYYVKENKLKKFLLDKSVSPSPLEWQLKNNIIYEGERQLDYVGHFEPISKYKFDLEHERLIEIIEEKKETETKEPKPKPKVEEKPVTEPKKRDRKPKSNAKVGK